jgi:leucyl/phenylalanyl-tRNA---protein transferase
MRLVCFPEVETETLLSPQMLRSAYESGWFPMAEENGSLAWYQPVRRALFPIDGIRVSRSLAKTLRRSPFEIRFDTAFEDVIRSCVRPEGNWINETIVQSYTRVHEQGWAHSAECWQGNRLVGGVYGLALGGCFSAESMFHRATDASKVALWALVERCRELGFVLFDAQVMNPHLARLGAYEVTAERYLELLRAALRLETAWSRTEAVGL